MTVGSKCTNVSFFRGLFDKKQTVSQFRWFSVDFKINPSNCTQAFFKLKDNGAGGNNFELRKKNILGVLNVKFVPELGVWKVNVRITTRKGTKKFLFSIGSSSLVHYI